MKGTNKIISGYISIGKKKKKVVFFLPMASYA